MCCTRRDRYLMSTAPRKLTVPAQLLAVKGGHQAKLRGVEERQAERKENKRVHRWP